MKKVFFFMFMMLFAFFNKAEAQMQNDTTVTCNHKGYEVEIDGMRFELDAASFTATLIDFIDSTKNDYVIPFPLQFEGRNFVVEKIEFMLGFLFFPKYRDYSFVHSLTIPNSVKSVCLGAPVLYAGINFNYNNINDYYAKGLGILSLNIPPSVETFSILNATRLKKLVIPKTVQEVNLIAYLPVVDSIIVEDDDSYLRWSCSNYKQFSGIDSEYLYIGRQLRGSSYYLYEYCYFGGHHPRKFEIGPSVAWLVGYGICVPSFFIPNTVEFGFFPCSNEDHFDEVIFEDGTTKFGYFDDGSPSYPDDSLMQFGELPINRLYIGRPGINLYRYGEIHELTIGPLLTSKQTEAFFNSQYHHFTITGDNAFVKLYQENPPELNPEKKHFSDETYIYTPLYVPRGSKTMYEQADVWKSFFHIIEFDLDLPEHDVQLLNSHPEYGYVTGAGNYHFGQTATLTAVPSEGHVFQCWMENGEVISRSNPYSFVVDRDRIITANFDGTGVDDNFSQNRINVSVKDRIISIEADGASVILAYNIQGQCVYRGYEKEFYVPCAGLYIVSIENKRIKVVVK